MSETPWDHPTPTASAGEKAVSPGFQFPIGFDPLRWIYALVIRIYWPVALALVLAIAGYIAGSMFNSETYSVSLQLIKKPIPSVIKTGELGDAFRPRQLNDRSLRSTLLAYEAIYKTATALGLDPNELRRSVDIDQLEGTDFFYITVHNDYSGEEAIEIVQLWADEIIHYTIALQRRESLAMRELLEEESNDLSRELEDINQRLLTFSTDNDFLDGDKQLEASLSAISGMELALEDARILLSSKTEQLRSLTQELQALSPISDQLKSAREELAQLRGRYTDANPLVKEKLYEIEYLVTKQKEEAENPGDDLRNFTGTPLGNQLYLEIVQARNQRLQLEQQVKEYERLLELQRGKLQNMPRKILRYSELLQQRDQLRGAYDMLNSRLQEARIFAENAPGYWEVFQSPTTADVNVTVNKQMALLLGLAGFAGGAGLGLLISLILEFRHPSPDFPLAYAIAGKALPALELPANDTPSWRAGLNAFWLTDLIRLQRDGYLAIITSHAQPDMETPFWQSLFQLAETDDTPIKVLDLSQNPGDLGAAPGQLVHWRELEDWRAWARKHLQEGPVLLRLNGDPYPAIIPILEQVGHWLCLVDDHCKPGKLKSDLRLYTNTLHSPDGLILIRKPAPNPLATGFEKAGLILGSLLRKKPTAQPA
ncbi:MAG: GumC family protein [Puniceicoccales bacterium]